MSDTYAGLDQRMEFNEADGHSYLDLVRYTDGRTESTAKDVTLNHGEISAWLKQEVICSNEAAD